MTGDRPKEYYVGDKLVLRRSADMVLMAVVTAQGPTVFVLSEGAITELREALWAVQIEIREERLRKEYDERKRR